MNRKAIEGIKPLLCMLRWLLGLGLGFLLTHGVSWAVTTEVTELRVERAVDGVYLSAQLRFDLPPVVEDALQKGIPLFFVVQADIYRDRWYWTDRQVASAVRSIRLAYQPLTRRWRVNRVSGLNDNTEGLRATLNQNYDTLDQALAAIRRLSRWKIAEPSEVEPDTSQKLEFTFRLDLSQLPRPFQIGIAGKSEWDISAEVKGRLRLEPATPPTGDSEGGN